MSRMVKDIHMSGKELTEMVQLRRQDVGDFAIVPSPKDRLKGILKDVQNPIKNFSFMEYEMYTGTVHDTKVTVMNGGRYAADTAITTELLCAVQIPTIIRLGSCGALREDMKIGDIVIAETTFRQEGVTPFYVEDAQFEPKSDRSLVNGLEEAAKKTGLTVHRGKVWSLDALLRQTRPNVEIAVAKGCIASDLVTSTFLTICNLNKIPAVAMLAVSDNVISGKLGFLDANFYMTEHMLTGICFEYIKKNAAAKQTV